MKKVIYKINRPYYKARLKRKGWFAICKVGRARWFTDGAAAFNLSYISITGWKKLEEVIFNGKAGKYDKNLNNFTIAPNMRTVLKGFSKDPLQGVKFNARTKKHTFHIPEEKSVVLKVVKVGKEKLYFDIHYVDWVTEEFQLKLRLKNVVDGQPLTIWDKKHLLAIVMPIRL